MKKLSPNKDRRAEGGKRLKLLDNCNNNQGLILISIVMVVYNGSKYIEEAIKSVINQTYKNIEFIVIDGCSTDQTVEIIRKYDDFIDYWVSEPDEGQSDAFNKAFSVCSGKVATWLNSDEILVPGCIEKVVKKLEENPDIKWISGDTIYTDHEKKIIKCRSGEQGANLLASLGILNVYGPSSFFSLALFESVGGMNKNLHYTMDTDLWWRFYQNGVKLYRLGEYVYIYRFHENSKTARYIVKNEPKNKRQMEENVMMCKKYLKYNNYLIKFIRKVFVTVFRLFSIKYVKSIMYSILFHKKYVDVFLKYLRIS